MCLVRVQQCVVGLSPNQKKPNRTETNRTEIGPFSTETEPNRTEMFRFGSEISENTEISKKIFCCIYKLFCCQIYKLVFCEVIIQFMHKYQWNENTALTFMIYQLEMTTGTSVDDLVRVQCSPLRRRCSNAGRSRQEPFN